MRTNRGTALMLALGFFLVFPSLAMAQQGTLTGRVVDARMGTGIPGANIQVQGPETQNLTAGGEGRFSVTLSPGTYSVVVSSLGHAPHRIDVVRVRSGEVTALEISLETRAVALAGLTVTAFRGADREVLDAPVSVSVLGEQEVRARTTATPLDHVRAMPGVAVATHGVQSGNVVTRGFNNIFSGSLLMLTDHRIAGIPSLRVNLMHMIPTTSEDVQRIEVALGPGSALYGPNTANGVLHILTKSPLESQETVFSVAGGERSLFQGTFRTSQLLSDNFGIKISGQYMQAEEWEFVDPAESVARDFDVERWSGEVRADWRIADQSTAIFQMGRTSMGNSIELTGVGAAQAIGWNYDYFQARFNHGRLFAQTYVNTSDAGDTFTLRDGDPIVDRSKLLVSQLQHGASLGERQDFIYGVDYIRTMPETEGTVHGRYEVEDQYDEFGFYLQSETSLTDQLRFIAAGRMDWHSELPDPVFSPRAALVFSPDENHAFRATFNKAFSTPTSVNLFLDINAGPFPNPALGGLGYGLRAQGSAGRGFGFRNADGTLTGMRSPFNPAGRHVVIPAEVPQMWGLAVGVLQAQGAIDANTAAFLMGETPMGGEVARAYLDVLAGPTPVPLTADASFDVPPLTESNTTTFELGYKGILADRVLLSADVWHERRENFISALQIATPLLFMEGQSLGAYAVPRLTAHFMGAPYNLPQEQAQGAAVQIATGMASLPVGVLSSEDVSSVQGRSDFLVTYRNFGDVNLWGADLAAQIILTDEWRLNLGASWVDRDVFTTDEGVRVALNAPTQKFSAGLGYRNEIHGFNAELRGRYNNEFPVLSAPYFATECIGDAGPLIEPCVDSFFLVDVNLGYRIPQFRGASVHLTVQNVLDDGYRSFAGVPEVGRMALLRLRYEF
jgi:outer membrane receptor for ferrienterochelin and colicins